MRGKEPPADSDEEEGKTLLELEEELSAAKKKQVLLVHTIFCVLSQKKSRIW